MGKEPIGSKVTIPKSGAQCCLRPLFRVNQPSKISPPACCLCCSGMTRRVSCSLVWALITCSNTL